MLIGSEARNPPQSIGIVDIGRNINSFDRPTRKGRWAFKSFEMVLISYWNRTRFGVVLEMPKNWAFSPVNLVLWIRGLTDKGCGGEEEVCLEVHRAT